MYLMHPRWFRRSLIRQQKSVAPRGDFSSSDSLRACKPDLPRYVSSKSHPRYCHCRRLEFRSSTVRQTSRFAVGLCLLPFIGPGRI
ncbi:hypothetical protein K466DRAFT_288641 [Polyporus arcularius HHB13444]|uniref:Uncharacterized protein n=1 Tax=Polyporus arcularius HHB13444 TaxID=1314778 RepID=A0A5C3P163_9APHY|nr:hypothetical protein K466DRAFT_288641 [Polyporus arcularius HHB13444]